MSATFKQKYQTTPLYGGNADYVEALYEQYLVDPQSVSAEWSRYFRGLQSESAPRGAAEQPRLPVEQALLTSARARRAVAAAGGLQPDAAQKQAAVIKLIESYRGRGHLQAKV
ncbi:MAG: 2-oxoglutarate dehydrogenase E1 subunit family protein, partial [Gammaproteobacteria bacterium]